MAAGRYLLSGHEGPYAVEAFTCGPGPDGWRYQATRTDPVGGQALGALDLLVDDTGRVLRLEVTTGRWSLRGGVVGGEVLWRRGDEERAVVAHGFTGTSPAYAVLATRLAAGTDLLRLVEVHDAVLATAQVDQRWTGAGESWTSVRLDTGETGQWQLRDGVVVTGPGLALLPE